MGEREMFGFNRKPAFEVKFDAENAFGEKLIAWSLVRAEDEKDAVRVANKRLHSIVAIQSVKLGSLKSVKEIGAFEAFARGAY